LAVLKRGLDGVGCGLGTGVHACVGVETRVGSRRGEEREAINRRAEDIRPGDEVLSFDVDGNVVWTEVVLVQHLQAPVSAKTIGLNLENDFTLHITPNHLVRQEKQKWVTADALEIGSTILFADVDSKLDFMSVEFIEKYPKPERVVNIHTMNNHILAEGVAISVHSKTRFYGTDIPLWTLEMLRLPFKFFHRLGLTSVATSLDVSISSRLQSC